VLHVEESGSGPRLVLAHGFTQTGRSWGQFARVLGEVHRLVQVDLPGHGGSSDVRADLAESADLVATAAGDEPFDLLGYSLGARVALHVAIAHPRSVRRLVLIGGTAGIEDDARRAERRRRDETLADDLEASGDLDAFLRRWLASPMFAGLRDPGLAERRRNSVSGLASSLRLAGTGTQVPLWDRLGDLAAPVLAVAGADDLRFCVEAQRMACTARAGVASLVPGAGHAAHLAQPLLAARLVAHFLA
jgi:2-succinyl-6-hydroxy-2,4-cyclohexadiene-1-carboxylate synthase